MHLNPQALVRFQIVGIDPVTAHYGIAQGFGRACRKRLEGRAPKEARGAGPFSERLAAVRSVAVRGLAPS